MVCGHNSRGVTAVILCLDVMEVHYGQGSARNGVSKQAELGEMTLTKSDVEAGVVFSLIHRKQAC